MSPRETVPMHRRSRGRPVRTLSPLPARRSRPAGGRAAWMLLPLLGLILAPLGARAQWKTQSFVLNPGWNAIYLHVDPSHVSLDDLIVPDLTNPITEVWRWELAGAASQFIESPQQPTTGGSQWRDWNRSPGGDSLVRLSGNAACLVRNSSASNYVWRVKGRPVPPQYQWTQGGENFIGFPTPESGAPIYDNFLAPAPELRRLGETFHYPGGEATGAAPNPQKLFAKLTERVTRGKAYWIRAVGVFNRYFGPFEVSLQDANGIGFGDSGGQYRFRLINLTDTARAVRVELLDSEAGPDGVRPPTPVLLVRGAVDLARLTYSHVTLNGTPQTYVLSPAGRPGSGVEIVLGLNRAAMDPALATGTVLAGILQCTDTTGLSQIDLPVSASVADTTGLWVGAAAVTTVHASLKSYARATNHLQFVSVLSSLGLANGNGTNYVRDPNTSLISVTTTNGMNHYLSTNFNTAAGEVPQAFPLRLIIHRGTNGTSQLLRQVFIGIDANTNAVLALKQSQLSAAFLPQSRRLTAGHLPWTASNLPWPMIGTFARGGTVSTTNLSVAYDDQASNPFLHTYHPDHDNLNATFDAVEAVGVESYGLERRIQLTFTDPASDFASLTAGTSRMEGLYFEEIRIKGRIRADGPSGPQETRQVFTSGGFVLNRISSLPRLSIP